jgi:hypothetical protein
MNHSWQEILGADPIPWLLESDEPWTRYRTLVDLLDRPEQDPEVKASRTEMLAHPRVQKLAGEVGTWGAEPFKRHNDASYPIYSLSTLADFGLCISDSGELRGLGSGIDRVLSHQAPEGSFETLVSIPQRFGGTGEGAWTWILCDAPTLLYSLLAMGMGDDLRVQEAVGHLVGTANESGWRCTASPGMGGFRGPGRKSDPCPMANVYALKALAQVPELLDSAPVRTGAEMLLGHWERQDERKMYLFGIGTDFRKLKYPYVWYDILHVAEVLSRFRLVHGDKRMYEMVAEIMDQADEEGRFKANSMYRSWQGWSFADKKRPSPWLTFLCCRILKRVYGSEADDECC